MFEHSITVPRLYKCAAKALKEVEQNHVGIKEACFKMRHPNIKAIFSLVSNVLKRSGDIEFLLSESKLVQKEPRLDIWLGKILIVELLWTKNRLFGASKPIKTILEYEQIFRALLSNIKTDNTITVIVRTPRFVRVNTLKIQTQEAVDAFRDEGWALNRFTNTKDVHGFLEAVKNLGSQEFMVDLHVKDLLIFAPSTEFFKHEAYLTGLILLQEKASCIPVQVLNAPPGSTILDMCAAPGNKTTQIAASIQNKGTIYAVEKDETRLPILKKTVEKYGATCVNIMMKDVLTVFDETCPGVEYILVDPSCSGSGMLERINSGKVEEINPGRLKKLQGFQIKVLKHALKHFPKAKRVVYSTCSLYREENEEVVREVLENCDQFKLVPCKDCLQADWLNFGSADYGDIGNFTLYSKLDVDLTIGFFVAAFERLQDGEVNPYYKPWTGNNEDDSKVDTNSKKKHKKGNNTPEVIAKNVEVSDNDQRKDKDNKKKKGNNKPIDLGESSTSKSKDKKIDLIVNKKTDISDLKAKNIDDSEANDDKSSEQTKKKKKRKNKQINNEIENNETINDDNEGNTSSAENLEKRNSKKRKNKDKKNDVIANKETDILEEMPKNIDNNEVNKDENDEQAKAKKKKKRKIKQVDSGEISNNIFENKEIINDENEGNDNSPHTEKRSSKKSKSKDKIEFAKSEEEIPETTVNDLESKVQKKNKRKSIALKNDDVVTECVKKNKKDKKRIKNTENSELDESVQLIEEHNVKKTIKEIENSKGIEDVELESKSFTKVEVNLENEDDLQNIRHKKKKKSKTHEKVNYSIALDEDIQSYHQENVPSSKKQKKRGTATDLSIMNENSGLISESISNKDKRPNQKIDQAIDELIKNVDKKKKRRSSELESNYSIINQNVDSLEFDISKKHKKGNKYSAESNSNSSSESEFNKLPKNINNDVNEALDNLLQSFQKNKKRKSEES